MSRAPIKTKIVRANNHEFMTKALRKAIMAKPRLKNVYLKSRNTMEISTSINFCTYLLRKSNFDYFRKLNVKDLNDNKKEKNKTFFQVKV